jgi:hypothetical protein
MALFGYSSDVDTFKTISKELVQDVISQQIGYYKIQLHDTDINFYGESLNKNYIGPVLLFCLIERGDFETPINDLTVDRSRTVTFRFATDDLENADIFPEIGDVVMYNELYYQVDNVNANQLIMGKDADYAYSQGLQKFGSSNSYSFILTCHYTRGEKIGLTPTIPNA